MKVRTRLVVSFVYILLVVIVALTIPLGIVLRDRARSELEALVLTNAQTIAVLLDDNRVAGTQRERRALTASVLRYASDVGGRVVVLDVDGTVIADSQQGEDLGEDFATPGRPEVTSALASQPSVETRMSLEEGGEIVVAAAPVIDEQRLVGAVRVSRGVDRVQDNVRRATLAIVIVAVAGLVAGLALAVALAGSLARPLTRLAAVARQLGRGDLSTRAGEIEGASEVQDLAGSFDEMADRVERTVRAQREFVANASHQLRTPLTGMKLRIESAIAESSDERVNSQLRAADMEVDRLAEIVQRLLTMAREIEEGKQTHADVRTAISNAVDRWQERAVRAGSAVVVTPSGDEAGTDEAVALVGPDDLDQVLDNLIDNAIAYGAGPIELGSALDQGRVVVTVRDHGPGIPHDERDRVTERFYRGRASQGEGSGLGLAIARELVERWNGTIDVQAAEGGGASIAIRLRRVQPSAARRVPDVPTDHP
ncbi:MAG TPA: HAMP domain-containing sensor histidine kinase [Actinomycetota bacterium]